MNIREKQDRSVFVPLNWYRCCGLIQEQYELGYVK